MLTIDLNSDVGESDDPAQQALESRIMPLVTSVNIACGVHAGSADAMRRALSTARQHGVSVGAHPGLPDREGAGRRERRIEADEAEGGVREQLLILAAIARQEGLSLSHVKPHGALYHLASRDRAIADAIVRAVIGVDRRLAIIGFAGSLLVTAAREFGIVAVAEAFADRTYLPDGSLVPRSQPDALIVDEGRVVERVLWIVRDRCIDCRDGTLLPLAADTICIHADTPGADRLVAAARRALREAGVSPARFHTRA
jgi:UPF0271 protein